MNSWCFFVLGFLCIRHNYFSVNIILEIMKFRIYECTLNNRDERSIEKIVISKNLLTLKKGHSIKLKWLNNEVMLDVKKDK